jgi:membrane protein implicated in regulation of membrane protease activity
MYLVAIGWLYVALMMAIAEAIAPRGTVLGAIFTFLLYGVAPTALLMYLLGTPGRKRRLREQERLAAAATSTERNEGGHAATGSAIAPEAEKP